MIDIACELGEDDELLLTRLIDVIDPVQDLIADSTDRFALVRVVVALVAPLSLHIENDSPDGIKISHVDTTPGNDGSSL